MENVTVNDLVGALNTGNKADANAMFNSMMSDRINDALDDKRIAVAQAMGGAQVEEPAEMEMEAELAAESEFDDDVTLEAENDNIQAVSDEVE